eukprot:1160642-Pelagomonas_calceolata.AAC.6
MQHQIRQKPLKWAQTLFSMRWHALVGKMDDTQYSVPKWPLGDLQPDCLADQPVTGPCQLTVNPKAQA